MVNNNNNLCKNKKNLFFNLNYFKCFINVCFIYYRDLYFINCIWNSMMFFI